MQSKLLAIYLNDHLAGATAGAAVARRVAGSNRESDTYYPALSRLAWRSLDLLAPREPRLRREQPTELIMRAERQLEEVEACRRRAVVDVFPREPRDEPS